MAVAQGSRKLHSVEHYSMRTAHKITRAVKLGRIRLSGRNVNDNIKVDYTEIFYENVNDTD